MGIIRKLRATTATVHAYCTYRYSKAWLSGGKKKSAWEEEEDSLRNNNYCISQRKTDFSIFVGYTIKKINNLLAYSIFKKCGL